MTPQLLDLPDKQDHETSERPDIPSKGPPAAEEFTNQPVVGAIIPREFLCGTLHDHRFKVREAFTVRLGQEGGRWTAEAPEFNEFGFGETWRAALLDLTATIVEFYQTVRNEAETLSPNLRSAWEVLESKVEAVPYQ